MIARSLRHLFATLALATAPALAADVVVVARLDGVIDQAAQAMIARAVATAEEQGARHLIVEISSPGGAVLAMDAIGQALDRSTIRPVTYVIGDALSAAAYVALCGDPIYTSPRSEIGSAQPILALPGAGILPLEGLPEEIVEKMMSDLRAKFRSRAELHRDRPGLGSLVEAMVDPDVEVLLVEEGGEQRPMTRLEFDDAKRGGRAPRFVKTLCEKGKLLNLTAHEAFDLGLSDGLVESRAEVLEALAVVDPQVRVVEVTWSERLFGAIGDWSWLLWLVAFACMIIEFKTPGFGIAGIIGLALIGLLLARNAMIGLAELPEILLVVLGVVLLAIEIMVLPGFGVAGILGIVCIAAGVVLSFVPFVTPETAWEEERLHETIRNFVLTFVAAPFLAYAAFRVLLHRLPIYRAVVLDAGTTGLGGSAAARAPAGEVSSVRVGDRGRVVSVLRPAGKVEVDGALIEASSGGEYVEAGAEIEVVAVETSHVVVRQVAAQGDLS
jgi:membrane-bound serine protease (ClpP class)